MAAFTCRSPPVAVLLFVFGYAAAAAVGPLRTPAVVTSASYLSADSDLIDTPGWLRTLFGVRLDDDDDGKNCVKVDKVFHRPSRACFLLFTRGPCARYDWLVFDRESAGRGNLTAVCNRRKCAPGWGFDAANGKCFRHGECPAPLVFHYSLFGDGVCRCNGSSERLATTRPRGGDPRACYSLYHHPPCPQGQMVAPRYRLFEGMDAVCFRDPCDGYKPPVGASSITTSAPAHGHHHHHHTNVSDSGGAGYSGLAKFTPNLGGRPFPRDEASSTGQFSQSAFDFEVEVMPVPNRPDLGIKTSTRAVVGSSHNHNIPRRNVAAPDSIGNNGSPTPADGPEAVPTHRHGLPGFKITLTPFRLTDVTSLMHGGRRRRGVQRHEIEPRSAPGAREEVYVDRGTVDSHVRVPRAAAPAWEIPDSSARSSEQSNRGVAGSAASATDDYALQVQYADGTRSCMSPSQLNVICDLTMVPLFSDYSELKVPICVNTLFRFTIGRIGKSEDCVQNDDGECATSVTVNSPDPLDWELE